MNTRFVQIIASAALLSAILASPVSAADSFLANRHVERSAACASCHGSDAPAAGAAVKQEACLACHVSLDKVAERTKAKKLDPDPHYNHLVGLDCLECHRGHKPSVNMCASCHNLEFKVP